MAKKQTRRSISVSGETYDAVRAFCDTRGLSASGLVTDLLERYMAGDPGAGAAGPSPQGQVPTASSPFPPQERGHSLRAARASADLRVRAPQAARDSNYPDRRGPGFSGLESNDRIPRWRVTAQVDISRTRQVEAQAAVETLLSNLVHRKMVNDVEVVRVEAVEEEN